VRVGFLVVLVAAAASAGTVSVQLPQGTKCDFGQLRAALRVPPGSVSETPQPDSVQLTLSREGEAWSLSLEAPGQATLERQAFAQGDDCVAVFEAAALIVDRYLSSIDWNASPGEVSPLPPPEPPTPLQLLVELSGGASYGISGVTGAGSLELGISYGALFFGAEGDFLGLGQQTFTAENYVVTQQTWAALAVGGVRLALRRSRILLAALAGAEVFHVSATYTGHPTSLPVEGSIVSALPFGGLRLGYLFAVSDRLSIGIRGSIRLHAQAAFQAGPTPLHAYVGDGDLTLVLGYLFF
jgi:hypothetical protein